MKETYDLDMFTRESQTNAAYEKIKDRKAFIVGCGNVGCVLATILAEGGIRDMVLCDFDNFSYVDNRQLYSTKKNNDKNKAIATAVEISNRVPCYVRPYPYNSEAAIGIISGGLENYDVFLCVDSAEARIQTSKLIDYSLEGKKHGLMFDVGVENNTIQILNYLNKRPADVYKENNEAHCVTIPLSSYRAFMAASIMAGAYYSVFETEGTEDEPLVPYDHALQVYTNTMTTFKRKI